jgi:hypothetical protein
MNAGLPLGPWRPGVDHAERKDRFRALAVLAVVSGGWCNSVIDELREAEHDDAAAARAFNLLDSLAALTRRRMLSIFGSVHQLGGAQP